MTDGSAHDSRWCHFWRIGRFVCGLAAVTAAMAAVSADVSAQITTNPAPIENPHLEAKCGLKVMLVLDESASIVSPGGGLGNQTATVREAANGFVTALEDTGSELATASFWNLGRPGIGYQEVTPTSASTFHAWVNGNPAGLPNIPNPYNPTTGTTATNWQDGLNQVLRTGAPNLVVFVTDGDPNTVGTSLPVTTSTTTAGVQNALNAGVASANNVKRSPARILAIGVGPAITNMASKERLTKISGTRVFPASAANEPNAPPGVTGTDSLTDADFTTVPFDELRNQLTGLVSALCGSRLIITKQVLDHNGDPVDASGWTYTATLNPPGGHTWLAPSQAGTGPSASLTTASNGTADFQWRLHSATNRVTVGVTHEQEKNGFHFVEATCRNVGPDGPIAGTEITSTTEIPGAELGVGDFRTCDVLNRQPAAELTVIKHLEPSDDAGKFNLEINGQVEKSDAGNEDSTPTLTLPLGPHTVSETAGTGTDLADYDTSIQCVDLANDKVVAENTGETSLDVKLTRDGQHIVCTITNESTRFGLVTVIKSLIPADDPGKFNLLVNGSPPNDGSESVGDGGTTGPIRLPFGTVDVTESAVPPTDLANYDTMTICTNEDNGGGTVVQNTTGPSVSFELSRTNNNVVCIIENRRAAVPVAHLTVVKQLVPSGDAGVFDLLIGNKVWASAVSDGGSTGRLEFELGKHTVTEHGADGTNLADFSISTTCVDKGHGDHTVAHNPDGPSVSVDLSRESDDVVCTITNKRTAPPPGPDEIPDTPGPHLGVVKDMPAHAHVGEEVPFTITVHNLGQGTATGVQVHETPPHGTQIVNVANHGRIQPNGTAVWHLGNLAPGTSRTVHGTLRVTQAGLHVNTAVATALNADPADSVAALRAPAPAPKPPAPPPPVVTG